MKLSDYENEDALDLIADIMEPSAKIFADGKISAAVKSGKTKIEIAKIAIKSHKSEIIEIFARLDNVSVKDYKCNVATIIKNLLDILNDEELSTFFISQGQEAAKISSTDVTVNTEENVQ